LNKPPKKIQRKDRIGIMDDLRGLSVLCMIFYHGFFLLFTVFGYLIGESLFKIFMPLQPIFASIFIIISGVSSNFSRSNAKRGLKLLLIALVLSIVTIYLLPLMGIKGLGIRFGILHMMACSMLLYALVRPGLSKLSPQLGFAIFAALFVLTYNITAGKIGLPGLLELKLPAELFTTDYLFSLGFRPPKDFESADYFPIIPYTFLFLAGTFLGRLPTPQWAKPVRVRAFAFCGRHALWIYIIHQPVLMVIFAIVQWIFG